MAGLALVLWQSQQQAHFLPTGHIHFQKSIVHDWIVALNTEQTILKAPRAVESHCPLTCHTAPCV